VALTGRNHSSLVEISDKSCVGETKRLAVSLAESAGFHPNQISNISIAVMEAGNNIVKHATRGEILLTLVEEGDMAALEMLALDKGPGISNVERSLADGYSTAGTSGSGLGAMRRLAHEFDIFSSVGKGTVIFAKFFATEKNGKAPVPSNFGGVCTSYPGEREFGDAWSVREDSERICAVVADGLGHGLMASEASHEAVRVFEKNVAGSPTAVLENVHGALRATRGAAVAIAELNRTSGEIKYSGVGNIAGYLVNRGKGQGLASINGIVGHQNPTLREFHYSSENVVAMVMHSDGINGRWDFQSQDYAGLLRRSPSLIAGVLYRDCRRGKDDATVIVIKPGENNG